MKRISVKLILLKTIKLHCLIHHFKGNVLVLIINKIELILLNRLEELEITGCDRITGIYLHKLGIKNLFASGCSRIVNQSLALKNIIELHIQGPLITTDGLMLLGENIKILKMINVSELNIGLANLCKLESLTLIMCKDIHNLTLLINLKKLDIFN